MGGSGGGGGVDNMPELLAAWELREQSCGFTEVSSDLQEQSSCKEKSDKALVDYYPEGHGHLQSSQQSHRKL